MRLNVLKVSALCAAVLCFAGCSHSRPELQTSPMQADQSGEAGPQTYGINGTSGYQEQAQSAQRAGGRTAVRGMHINALNAPANQTYYFNFDSNAVHQSDFQALNIQANYLATHPHARIRLEGNTDNRGSREYNVGLGWRRDQAVSRYLESRGVSPKQIQMVSYGKEHPAAYGDNASAWQLNRRVNMVYKVKS